MKLKNIFTQLLLLSVLFIFSCNGSNTNGSNGPITKAMQIKNGIGEKYGSRDPRTCADKKNPTTGIPSAEQAKEYFICFSEHEFVGQLYLVDDVKLETGKPRAYNPNEDLNVYDIDVNAPVLPIRGSYKQYQCSPISDYMQNRGKNCNISEISDATGLCYKNSFGEWVCKMGSSEINTTDRNVAPPQ